MRFLSAALIFSLFSLSSPVQGQEETPPIFGEVIDVRVVNVEVVVTDRDGNRVPDLKTGDFRLKVDGKEVPISFFTEVRGGQSVAPAGEAGQEPVAGSVAGVEPGGEVGTSYLVFIDDYFSIEKHRNEVLRSLKDDLARLGPQDRMAIVAFDGGRLSMLSTWSGSANQLARAIDVAMGRPARGLDRVTELRTLRNDTSFAGQSVGDNAQLDLNARVLGSGLNLTQQAYADTLVRQIDSVASAAVSTLRAFAAPPGRKVMVLLSGGWPFSVTGFLTDGSGMPSKQVREGEELLRPLTNTANLLGYTVYPVDVPGMQTVAADASLASPQGINSFHEQEIEGTLEFLAQQTGGKPIRNSNRNAALREASADTRSYYWLGFSPAWERNDKRHKVDVDVLRPGLRVRARQGFLDLSKKAEVSMMLESALLFGNLPGGLQMPLKVGTPVRGKKGVEIPITLGLPVAALTVVPIDGKFAAQAELRIAASNKEGNSSEIPVIPITLKSDQPPKPGGFVRYDTKITLRGGANHLVIALYDPLSGKLATAETDIVMP